MLKCPSCDGIMYHHEHLKTHIWVCNDCPNIVLEYVERQDLEHFTDFMQTGHNPVEDARVSSVNENDIEVSWTCTACGSKENSWIATDGDLSVGDKFYSYCSECDTEQETKYDGTVGFGW